MAEWYGNEFILNKGHKEDCICGKCTGEDATLEQMNKDIVQAERNFEHER